MSVASNPDGTRVRLLAGNGFGQVGEEVILSAGVAITETAAGRAEEVLDQPAPDSVQDDPTLGPR